MAAIPQARLLAIVAIMSELEEIERKKKQKKITKRWWVRQINRRRLDQGDFSNLVRELRGDEEQFYVYFRMSPRVFDELLCLVGPSLRRKDTQLRQSVKSAERLAITLRRLATPFCDARHERVYGNWKLVHSQPIRLKRLKRPRSKVQHVKLPTRLTRLRSSDRRD